jgi:hypothetical protein
MRLLLSTSTAPVVLALLTGCGSSDPIAIQPRTPVVAASLCPLHHGVFAIARVEDRRGYADVHNVGFTQTGMDNVKANLETDRPAAAVLEDALRATLRQHCPIDAR